MVFKKMKIMFIKMFYIQLKTGKKIHCRMRMRLRHFDGYYIWVESHARLLVNAVTRAPESIMCTMKPISFSESYTAKAGTFSCSDQGVH